jgi:hypothetical protein
MADETVPLMDNLLDLDRELANHRHWLAFDLAIDCAVGYHQARAALDACEWDVDQARRQLQADTAALDATLHVFNTEVDNETARALGVVFGVKEADARAVLERCGWSVVKARKILEATRA